MRVYCSSTGSFWVSLGWDPTIWGSVRDPHLSCDNKPGLYGSHRTSQSVGVRRSSGNDKNE